jgi:hypothetical protein
MANTILTTTAITRKALMILHQKCNFIGNINRQYDSSFAKQGAKIGDSLRIRLPNQFVTRTGKTINVQDTTEESVTLQVNNQIGVDFQFDSSELTLSMDDYSERVLEPAMSALAAKIESNVISTLYKNVYQEISDVGATATEDLVLAVGERLTNSLCPADGRILHLTPRMNRNLINAMKALYNDPKKISENFRQGKVADGFLGFEEVYQNTHWPLHTTGTDDGTGDYLTDIAAGEADGSEGTLHIDTGAGTFKAGDVFYIADCLEVHPETKASTGRLLQIVVTADFAGSEGDLSISPNLITSGARQNCTGLADGKALHKEESDFSTDIAASADYFVGMGFHPNAFTFATADLVLPKGAHMAAREVMDGISMRFWADGDITNDNFPARFDVLYGTKVIRPQLACRLGLN